MEFHEAANIFPMDDENLDSLADDIKQHGQQVAIETLNDQIVDGRRRFMACKIAGVEPIFRKVKVDDPVAYVLSLNLHRRHLSETQRGMIAARAEKVYSDAAAKRMSDGGKIGRDKQLGGGVENLPQAQTGKARDKVGAALGVSGKTVSHGKKVLASGTEKLIAAVDADKIAVSTAAKVANLSPEQQDAFVEKAKGKPTTRKERITHKHEDDDAPPPGERQGVGIIRGNEAIDCLKRIPKNDRLRKRGLQVVSDWIRRNKEV